MDGVVAMAMIRESSVGLSLSTLLNGPVTIRWCQVGYDVGTRFRLTNPVRWVKPSSKSRIIFHMEDTIRGWIKKLVNTLAAGDVSNT
jgi:hypothetical protein